MNEFWKPIFHEILMAVGIYSVLLGLFYFFIGY